MYDEDKGEVYEEYTIDGGHFTKLGYDVVTSLVRPVIIEARNDYYGRWLISSFFCIFLQFMH